VQKKQQPNLKYLDKCKYLELYSIMLTDVPMLTYFMYFVRDFGDVEELMPYYQYLMWKEHEKTYKMVFLAQVFLLISRKK
jgi:hypothetical protein